MACGNILWGQNQQVNSHTKEDTKIGTNILTKNTINILHLLILVELFL